jgi:predicted nucleic acid binding AN1-type Zn finger protein
MKCPQCKKKSHLEFKCMCGGVYCVKCRTPEVHACVVKVEKVVLPLVVADKLPDRV